MPDDESRHLRVAQAMAMDLARSKTDPNEVAKVFTYLRTHRDGRAFFALLETMVNKGSYLVRSGQTPDYYRQIRLVCDRHLRPYLDQPDEMAHIMGWAVRLLRYYQTQTPRPPSAQPERATPPRRPPARPPQGESADDMPQWKKDLLKVRRNL